MNGKAKEYRDSLNPKSPYYVGTNPGDWEEMLLRKELEELEKNSRKKNNNINGYPSEFNDPFITDTILGRAEEEGFYRI